MSGSDRRVLRPSKIWSSFQDWWPSQDVSTRSGCRQPCLGVHRKEWYSNQDQWTAIPPVGGQSDSEKRVRRVDHCSNRRWAGESSGLSNSRQFLSIDERRVDRKIPEMMKIGLKPFPVFPSSGKIDRQQLMKEYRIQEQIKSSTNVDWLENFLNDHSLTAMSENELRVLIQVVEEVRVTNYPTSMTGLKTKNFFRVGGSSLNAILVVSKLKSQKHHVSHLSTSCNRITSSFYWTSYRTAIVNK